MENLFYNISQVLGITIIHSLWQGFTIYIVLSMLLQFLPDMAAASKYKLAFTALSLMLGWFAFTLYFEIDHYTWVDALPNRSPLTISAFAPVVVEQWQTPAERYYAIIARYLPYVTLLYLAGLVFNTLRMILAWNNIYRIRQTTTVVDFQQQVTLLAQQMGIGRFIQAAYSQLINVPCITGFFKPIILLPFSISTYLSAQEIEAILLHELAHIKRNDYLANLIQQVIGILLFFNPFSRLISRIINTERENSCDDAVVRTTGSPLIYAQALLKLEQNKHQQLQLALAATGKKYHLLNRIERIMKTKKTNINIRPALIALVLLTCSLSSIAWFNPKKHEAPKQAAATVDAPADTLKKAKHTPSKKALKYKKATGTYKVDYDNPSDAEIAKMTADIEKTANEMAKTYQQSPELKELQARIAKKSAELEKLGDDPKMKELQARLDDNGKKIEAYYNSPEYKKKQREIEKQGELLSKYKPGSDEFNQHLSALIKMSVDFGMATSKPIINEQVVLATKMAGEVMSKFNSDDFKSLSDSMKSLNLQYDIQYDKKANDKLNRKIEKLNKKISEDISQQKFEAKKQRLEKTEQTEKIEKKVKPEAPIAPEEPVKPTDDIKADLAAKNWKLNKSYSYSIVADSPGKAKADKNHAYGIAADSAGKWKIAYKAGK